MKESTEVLARKYRPKNFDELIGQESISTTLSLALDTNRLSHAYLFSGLRGSGKTSTARIFAKALVCDKGISSKPCDECENCIAARENRHIDIIEMDAASSRKIDDIRDLIEQTKYKPSMARFKIFIIDEVHMLTKEAFNALLKTLEEPPEFVKFILATTDPLKLPATILSRTQHFRFKKIAQNKVVAHLKYILAKEGIEFEDDALDILARSGNGSLRDTLTLLDQAIIYSKGFVDVPTVTDMLGLVDPKFIDELFDAVFEKDREKLVRFIEKLQDYEAEMVVDELIIYLKEKMLSNHPKFSTLIIERFFRILSQSKYLFSINADGDFVLSLVLFKMVEALNIKDIDELIENFEAKVDFGTPLPKNMPQTEKQEEKKEEKIPPKQTDHTDKFQQLVKNIAQRNYELGECFEKHIKFVSFEDGVLTWESSVDEECKEKLKHAYSVIKMLVWDIFGVGTKIKAVKKEPTQYSQPSPSSSTLNPQPSNLHSQPSSMVEEAEVPNTTSCVASCAGMKGASEVNDIVDEPVVKKAIELFEAKKVIVQSKV